VAAATTITDNSVNMSGNITTTSNVSASYFVGDGSLLTGVNNSNSTTWWSSVSSWLSGWLVNNAGVLEFNDTKLNDTIDSRDSDTTYDFQCSAGQFVKNLTSGGSYVCDTPAGGSSYLSLYSSGNFNGSLYTTSADPSASDSNSIFQVIGSNGAPQFQIQNGGDSQASFVARSFLVVNENATRLNQSQNNLCSDWGFTQIDCNSSTTGADMGVQDDLEVGGLMFADQGIHSDTSTWGSYLYLGNITTYASGGANGTFTDSEDYFCDYVSNPFTSQQVGNETWVEITDGTYEGASAMMGVFINSSCVMLSANPAWVSDLSNQEFRILPAPVFSVSDGGFAGLYVGSDSHSKFEIKVENGSDFYGMHLDDVAGADQHKAFVIDVDVKNKTGVVGEEISVTSSGGSFLDIVGLLMEINPINLDNSDYTHLEFHNLAPLGTNALRVIDIYGNYDELIRHEEVEVIDYVGYYNGATLTNITTNATSSSTNMELFSNDNDEVYFCDSTNLSEIVINLQIPASSRLSIDHYYYASDGTWKLLQTTDTTNDFTKSGNIEWTTPSDINLTTTDRNANSIGGSYYCIALQRTRNNVVTAPVENLFAASGGVAFLLRDDLLKLTPVSAPPFTCDSSYDGAIYYDSDVQFHCSCKSGTGWVQMNDYSTGCS